MGGWIEGWVGGQMGGRRDGWMEGWVEGWVGGGRVGWGGIWTEQWMEGWPVTWVDGRVADRQLDAQTAGWTDKGLHGQSGQRGKWTNGQVRLTPCQAPATQRSHVVQPVLGQWPRLQPR